ncbi:hypothetical protein EST38_g2171 [Candolleomyces aberdarensis]|uniref:F-box domain-containing protein n=1 Tax=Candolleomyces aberdarensis TaxID=2316362 RepID=A0A4Q2DU91_9AGAR|nr:hypothetical protein EST38_g2171 [Candolleomyces aberdarensis]
MVKTRAQSGVAIKPPTSKALEDEGYEIDDKFEPESSDENTGKKKRKSQKTNGTPKAKRQKTSKPKGTNKGTPAKEGRRRKTLSLLPTMPLDVLFEIFSHLSPRDLLNLARTSKMLKKTMLDPETNIVWKTVRAVYGAPEPAIGFSEPKWAAILFESNCNSCGTKNVPRVDWRIQKRLCSACKQSSLLGVKDPGFKTVFEGYDLDMFNYIPHINERGPRDWKQEMSDSNWHLRKLFWANDVHAFAKEWSRFRDAAQRSPEGRVAFNAWKDERKQLLQSINEMARVYEAWVYSCKSQKYSEMVVTSKVRLEAVKKRLLKAGYGSVDVNSALTEHTEGIRTGSANVTNSAWATIRPKLEAVVIEARNKRVSREMQPLIKQRFEVLKEVYNEHLKYFSPAERYCCPPAEFLWRYTDTSDLLEADPTVSITNESFQSVIDKVDERVAEYQAEKKKKAEESARWRVWMTIPRISESLHLARHVFQCEHSTPAPFSVETPATYQTLIGWDMIAWLPCVQRLGFELRPGVKVDRPSEILYDDRGSEVSSGLISLAGLDPAEATIADMDARDARYVLLSGLLHHFCIDTYPVFTWRAALYFVADKYRCPEDWDPPTFRLATPEETDRARQHSAALQESAKAWSCNHCHDFFDEELAETKSTIVQHVKDMHGVSDPKVKEDYIVNPHLWPKLEAPCQLPLRVTSPVCFECRWCPETQRGEVSQ